MNNLLDLIEDIEEFPVEIQKRLNMMDKMFLNLTNFCESGLIPTTNNVVENYFFKNSEHGLEKKNADRCRIFVSSKIARY
jgi:hypothetical protein